MKVLHINTSQTGGAAWCAIRISKALSAEGIESRMLFAEGASLPEGVDGAIALPDNIFWNKNVFLRFIKKVFSLLGIWFVDVEKTRKMLDKANISHLYLHQPLSYFKNIAHHPLVEWADIIHLHWVSDFVDYSTFFKAVKKPIVWTLHDKYPAMGVMHYASKFYPIPNELKRVDAYFRKMKREGVLHAQNLNIVAISELMIDICKKSDVLREFPVMLIHNGVDTNTFQQHDKQTARIKTGVMPDAKVFIFSSYYISDPNKGLDRAIAALERVDVPNKMLVCIGDFSEGTLPQCSFPVIWTGKLNDTMLVSMYYSAADFFLLCSYEETVAQTPLEAMACGTPVISTPCCGAKDLIRPFNGIICSGYDVEAIAAGIREGLLKHFVANEIRKYVVENFKYNIIAKQYIELYNKVNHCETNQ